MENIDICEGVLHINGQKKIMVTADYPYYRDHKNNWADRLQKLKDAYIDVITFYVPWRHHALLRNNQIVIDFEGQTQANRDVKSFIQLCNELGLLMVIKPGPFIHAETNFGGLPDFVNPETNPQLELMLDHQYQKRIWQQPLPAPLQANFQALVNTWFAIVDQELIQPNQFPAGKAIAIQILNEGIYSDAQHSPLDYDYSESSLTYFRKLLRQRYQDITTYNSNHQTSYPDFAAIAPPTKWEQPQGLPDLLKYLDWSAYQPQFMKELYREYGSYLQTDLPFILNINPALAETAGLDYWLTRIQPEEWPNVNYGFTNWIGVVSHDESAYQRYLTLVKRGAGPNMEENWGFSKLYDSRYRYPVIPFFQTILAIAAGATGYNVYTGVGTAGWDKQLDNLQEQPYPDCAPITHEGELTSKYQVLQLLNEYLQTYGQEILESATNKPLAYGLYPPYAYLAAWNNEPSAWAKLGLLPPRCGYQGLDAFQNNARNGNFDFSLVNLQTATAAHLANLPVITLVGGFFMAQQVQRNLVEYVCAGGKLILLSEVPQLDEHFQPCSILNDALFGHVTGKTIQQAVVDGIGEDLAIARILNNIPGQTIYTVSGETLGYRTEYGEGHAYFIAANLFAKNDQPSATFMDLLHQVIPQPDLTTDDPQTQVWCYRHSTKEVSHVFILSKTAAIKWHEIKLSTRCGGWETLRIKLPAKSAAIVRLENQQLTSFLVKGVNEYEASQTTVAVEYADKSYSADGIGDILYLNDHGQNCQKMCNRVNATYR